MPQLVKGGKHVFGWSKVGDNGEIVIPPEAVEEYLLGKAEHVILISGSVTSGGFSLCKPDSLRESPMARIIQECPEPSETGDSATPVVTVRRRSYSRVTVKDGRFVLSLRARTAYGIKTGDWLLAIRGSGLGVSFGARGSIIEEAKLHPELGIFEP